MAKPDIIGGKLQSLSDGKYSYKELVRITGARYEVVKVRMYQLRKRGLPVPAIKRKRLSSITRKKMSDAGKGRVFTAGHKKRIGKATRKAWRAGVFEGCDFGRNNRHGYRKDLGHYVRSSWEANYARYLKYKGIKYQYEPKRFHLKALDSTYLPDFLLEDGTYVEVKGWDRPGNIARRNAFRNQYNARLLVIAKHRYAALCRTYQHKIANWEIV